MLGLFIRRVLVPAAVAAVLLPAPAHAQAPAVERIHTYDVAIAIERDGRILVVERIDYDFGGAHKHGIFRDIPVRLRYDDTYDRIYDVEVVSVRGSPGTPAQYELEEVEGGILRIRIGDPDRTITGRHGYTITYRVRGALNAFGDHDELYWNAIGSQWAVPIDGATVGVTAPAKLTRIACFAGPEGSSLACRSSRRKGNTATFGHAQLFPYTAVTVVVGLPKGAVPQPRPILEERWSLGRAFEMTPMKTAAAGLLLLGLLLGIVRLLWVAGRDRRAVGSPVDVSYGTTAGGEQQVPLMERSAHPVEYVPPDRVRPGQLGTLLDERANPLDVTATIVDLAVRGYLRIEEIPKRWLFGKPDWRLLKLNEPDENLLRYERILLNGLFSEADETEDQLEELEEVGDIPPPPDAPPSSEPVLATVKVSSLKKRFVQRLKDVQDALYDDAVKNGWFAGRPDKVRETWATRGWLLAIVGGGLTWLAAAKTRLGLLPVPLVIAGLLLIVVAKWMPRRTAKGTGLVRRVNGFRTYIETAEVEEARFAEAQSLFSQYLPYAIVFGATERWARAFGKLGDQPPQTPWYVGSRPFTVGGFGSSIDSFTVTAAGTIASTPGGSGGSGFSGGGAGGGGGGGGGGSW